MELKLTTPKGKCCHTALPCASREVLARDIPPNMGNCVPINASLSIASYNWHEAPFVAIWIVEPDDQPLPLISELPCLSIIAEMWLDIGGFIGDSHFMCLSRPDLTSVCRDRQRTRLPNRPITILLTQYEEKTLDNPISLPSSLI